MKKSLFLLMAASTCVLLLNSCTKESSSSDNGMIPLTITAGLPDTKATFTDNGSVEVKWKTGTEYLSIYAGPSSQTPNTFSSSLSADAVTAPFTGTIPSGTASGSTLYAVYPSTTVTDPTAISFDLSAQTGNGNNLSELATKLPMVASATYVQGKNPTLQFSNKVAILKLILKLPVTGTVSSVAYGGYDVHNKATLNATTGAWTYTDIGLAKVTYSEFSVTKDVAFTVYLGVFPEEVHNATVLVTMSDGSEYSYNYTDNITSARTVSAGKIYTLTIDGSKTKTLALNTGEFNYTGDGSSAHPFLISTPAQLGLLSTRINAATAPYSNSGTCYKQTADIALSETFTPIGTEANTFKGEYDGNSKSITGLSVNSTVAGLFGYNAGTVKSLSASGTVSGTSRSGGIVGNNTGSISYCNFTGSISTTGATFGAGGIVGESSNGTITNCTFTGGVTGTVYVGGIAGRDHNGTISECTTTASGSLALGSTTASCNAGGIVGCAQLSKILHCTNTIPISCSGSEAAAGGIVGCCDNIVGASIEACTNTASVTASANQTFTQNTTTLCAGGLIGRCTLKITLSAETTGANYIRGCINSGNVSCANGFVGGFIGYVKNSGSNGFFTVGTTSFDSKPANVNGQNSIIAGCYSTTGTVSTTTGKSGNSFGYMENVNIYYTVANNKGASNPYGVTKSCIGGYRYSGRTSFQSGDITNLNAGWLSANSSRIYRFNSTTGAIEQGN